MNRSDETSHSQAGFIRRVVIVLALGGLAVLLWRLRHMLLLIFGAVVVAVIFRALAKPLRRKLGLPDGIAVTLSVLILVAALGLIFWLFGQQIASEAQSLGESLPAAWRSFESSIGNLTFGQKLMDMTRDAAPSGSGVLASAGSWATWIGASVTDALLVLVGGIYLAAQPKLYRTGLLKLLPAGKRDLLGEALDDSGRALKAWLQGQLIAMTAVGLMVGIGLWLLGVPFALALGLLAGLLDFVPLVGPIVAAVPAILLALTVGPEIALWTAALYLLVQQIEGNILSPIVQHHAVDLPPALFLFALLGFGSLFSVTGVILAVPLTVVVYVLVKRLYVREALDTETSVPGEQTEQ